MRDNDKTSDEIIYEFDDSNCNIMAGVAEYYHQLGFDAYCLYDPKSNTFGGGNKILIKRVNVSQ
jgi:hypothetical protein